jgi:hypothetical protein
MAAIKLAYRRQPSGAASGVVMDYPPILEAQNFDNSVDTTFSGTVALAGTGLGGTTSLSCVNGVVKFLDTLITGTSAVTIAATSSGLTGATSASFTPVTPSYDAFALAHGVLIEGPRETVDTTYPTISSSVTVGVGKTYPDVQTALAALVASDTAGHREIICSNNETVGTSVVCPARAAGMGWIIIRSATLPPALTRIHKGDSVQLAMPKLTSEQPLGIVQSRNGTHHIRTLGMWVDEPIPAGGDATEYTIAVDFSDSSEFVGTGTVACVNGVATFSTSQASTPFFGAGSSVIITDDSAVQHYYPVRYFNGTTGCTLAGTVADKLGNPGVLPNFTSRTFALTHNGNVTAQPHHLLMDRCYISGKPTVRLRRGVMFGGPHMGVIHSRIDEVHDFFSTGNTNHPTGSIIAGTGHFGNGNGDTQAIAGIFGPGPYLIHNSTLQAAGENTLFGGTDPVTLDLVPSDLTITGNFYDKPLSWQGVYPVKNSKELKNARRVLVTGNVFNGSWAENQTGTGIGYATQHQNGTAPWTVVRDVAHYLNYHANMTAFVLLSGNAADTWFGEQAHAIAIYDNLAVNINGMEVFSGDNLNRAVLLAGMDATIVRHNTILAPAGNATKALVLTGDPNTSSQYDDNLTICESYGVVGDSGFTKAAVALDLPDDAFADNGMIGYPDSHSNFTPDYPTYFLADLASCGFANPSIASTWGTADPDTVCAALALTSAGTTDLRTAATDSLPVGVRDMSALRAAIAGVLDGIPVNAFLRSHRSIL